jgi:hypothetical protein
MLYQEKSGNPGPNDTNKKAIAAASQLGRSSFEG